MSNEKRIGTYRRWHHHDYLRRDNTIMRYDAASLLEHGLKHMLTEEGRRIFEAQEKCKAACPEKEELLKTDPYKPIPTGFLIEQACPFCGAWFAYLHHVTDDNRQHVCKIVCLRCGAGAPDNVGDEFHSTVEKSVAAWNERPPEQANRDRYTKHKDNSEE